MVDAVSVWSLVQDPQVWVYFALLAWSLRGQLRCTTLRRCGVASALVAVTWFYILRFTIAYKNGGGTNLFDAAYIDVLLPARDGAACQLLSWVAVAVVWARREPVEVLWTGMLGAMSAAFALTPVRRGAGGRIPVAYAACTALSLAAIAALPRLLDAPVAFGVALKALHLLLVAPRFLPTGGGDVAAGPFYALCGVAIALRNDRPVLPATDCQTSIFVDLVACAVLSCVYVRGRHGSAAATVFAAVAAAASPGAALALYLALVELAAAEHNPPPFAPPEVGRVLVVGAGPAGLCTAKALLAFADAEEVVIAERTAALGGVFADAYEGARMVSSKFISAFSDFRLPATADDHLSLDDYAAYLRAYAAKFDLARRVRYDTEVVAVRRRGGGYAVTLRRAGAEKVERFDAVAVCAGLHQTPRRLADVDEGDFCGRIIHSEAYKSPSIFDGARVVVVGAGETAFDVAHAAATVGGARAVTMSTRRGFVSVPATFGEGLPPLDCVIMNAGTHYWESDWGRRVGVHWWITTKLTRVAMLLFGGSTAGWNQWVGASIDMDWVEGRKHVVNKSTKCMPLLNRGADAKRGVLGAPYRAWDASSAGIPVTLLDKYEPVRFEKDALVFRSTAPAADEARVAADVVVLCTGYVQNLSFLEDDALPTTGHFILDPDEPTLAYIGYVRPNVGAIPPMAELQALWWVATLAEATTGAAVVDGRYKLTDRRVEYGVDYGYYMFALAQELGVVPNLARWILERPAVAVAAAFGQAHAPIFLLDGPFASPAAADVCATELLAPLRKRGLALNAVFLFNLVFFGAVNAVAATLTAAEAAAPSARTCLVTSWAVFLAWLAVNAYLGV